MGSFARNIYRLPSPRSIEDVPHHKATAIAEIRTVNMTVDSTVHVHGIGGAQLTRTQGVVTVTLQSINSNSIVIIQAHILKTLTSIIPSADPASHDWSHLQGLPLVDPQYFKPRTIDIILGSDTYGQIIKPRVITDSPHVSMAQLSIFRWLVLGPATSKQISIVTAFHVSWHDEEEKIHELFLKFWVLEEVHSGDNIKRTPEEQQCEEYFKNTHSRDLKGRYIVRIPLTSPSDKLGSTYNTARRFLQSLLNKFVKSEEYRMHQFMIEYKNLGHMKLAPTSSSHQTRYYLPHHGVLKPDNTTTKLRIVFNGSCKSTSGLSLNDIMYTGPNLNPDISDALIWIRRQRYLFATDIRKIYRQIRVHEDDWDLQRSLWINENNEEVSYHLTTATYGKRAAPFLAVRTLLQLVEDEGEKYPLAVPSIIHGRYVDDIFGSADTPG
ncbi:PREDICTED: uncharacterized protein LOC105365842 [Ceratosolen solmsi marchali]|uniref:Uncharacterized protein LOC105365842 n=1 Tax=Ceratosolen solmsi marchali TaxID=326594 RepID=A0AAJ6YQM5_9HYME|nr:PREDICTED: uncharacterized protein LOC105365842 [Ceratosolen solmsi marchali]